jgi:hypothetical protein
MDYSRELTKIMKGARWFVYRGYSGQIDPNGGVIFGDAHLASKQQFREFIDHVANKKAEALKKSITRSENILYGKKRHSR